MEEEIEGISKISKVGGNVAKAAIAGPNADHFQNLMNQQKPQVEQPVAIEKVEDTQKLISPIDQIRDLNQKTDYVSRSNANDLVVQSQDVIAKIDSLKTKLEAPDLQLNGAVRTALRSKLDHIDESLKIAISKAGGEHVPYAQPTGLMKPIDRFLGLLTHGQTQLETLTKDIQTMETTAGGEISPAKMLLIQIKVGHVQQEIELFTSMLSKALESTKTIMNVQV